MTGRSVAFANGVVYELREDRGVGDCSWLNINRWPAEGNEKSERAKAAVCDRLAPVLLVLRALEKFEDCIHNLGCFGVMAKPFTVDELSTKVHQSMTRTAIPRCQRPEAARARFDWQYCQLETR